MIPTISISHDLEKLTAWARFVAADQVPFATAVALNETGKLVKVEFERQMDVRFERPTPYTKRAFRLFPASKTKLSAVVHWREDARHYLDPQVEGGPRRAKGLEGALRAAGVLPSDWYAVPGQGARLDAHGNMDRGQVVQILSQLRVQITAGYSRSMTYGTRQSINAQRKAGGRFFVIGTDAGRGQPGVYQREFMGNNITPVVIFVKTARYKVRFPIKTIAAGVVREHFAEAFRRAFARAQETAR